MKYRYTDTEYEINSLNEEIEKLREDIQYYKYETDSTYTTDPTFTAKEFLKAYCGGLDLNTVVDTLKEKYPENFL